MKFLHYRRAAATATVGICWWKTFQNRYQTKYLTKSTGWCWKQHRFQLSTSLVCTNSRSMKNAKYPPSSSVQHTEQVTVHGSAWFCKGFVLCSAQKEIKRKHLHLATAAKSATGLNCQWSPCSAWKESRWWQDIKIKINCFVRTSFNFVRQGSTNCTEQIEPCSASKIGLDRELHGACCVQCLPKSISLQLWRLAFRHSLKAMHPTQRFDVYMKGRFRGKSLLGEGPLLAMYKSSTCICLPNSHQAPTYIPYPLTYDAHPLT